MRHSVRKLGFLIILAVLVSGAGLMLRAQLPQQVGTWVSLGASPEARVGAAAVTLADGRTVIAGGLIDGTPTDAVVIYDPADGSFGSAGQLLAARTGHTATLLEDGRIAIAGGTVNNLLVGDIELFDPATGASVLGAAMAERRSGHAAARLPDGTVLIAGGVGSGGVLQSAEIFDPETGGVAMVPSQMLSPRTGASATTLIDGRVLIAGGNNGTADLASAEIYYAPSHFFQATDTSLSVPRSGHTAVLLPHNNSVLIAGGSSNGAAEASSDLFLPAEFPDPYSYGMGQFAATGEMAAARAGAAGAPDVEGYAVVVGGGAADAEAYHFATIKTDKDDYAPGERALITGTGWQPGETVRLVFQEDPAVHDDYVLNVTARTDGTIYWDQWAPEEHDLGVRFYLTAKQGTLRAQTTFTDGTPQVDTVSNTPFSPNQASSAGVKDDTDIEGKNQGGGAITDFRIRIRAGSTAGALVREFFCGNLAGNGTCTRTWNGKDSSDAFVADGTYVAIASNGTTESTTPANRTRIIVVDNTNPTVTLLTPAHGATVGNPFRLEASPLDAGGGDANIERVEFYVDSSLVDTDTGSGGGWRTNDLDPADFGNGNHTWFVRAYDGAGNNADSESRTFVVAAADGTAPTTVITLNPATPNGDAGWYVSNVQLTVAATDNGGGSGVAETRCVVDPVSAPASFQDIPAGCAFLSPGAAVTTDGIHTVYAASVDAAGNEETPVSASFQIDKTAPSIVFVGPDPAPNANGWNNTNVTLEWSCTDEGSGVVASSVFQTITSEGTNQQATGTCQDLAGNSASSTDGDVDIDKTGPDITFVAANPAPNGNNWNNTDVTLEWSCADSGSGVVNASVFETITTEGTDQSATGTCEDNAGNTASSEDGSVNIDKTAPNAPTGARTPPANAAGWNNTDVTVTFTANGDAGPFQSGVDMCSAPADVTGETSGTDVVGTCTDKAGNVSSNTTVTVKIDQTAPNAPTGTKTPAANAAGWNNSDVTVTFTSNGDAGVVQSGVDACTEAVAITTETSGTDVNGTCTDIAGNVSAPAIVTVKLDKTDPVITFQGQTPAKNANGWNNTDVTLNWSCTDDRSGTVAATVSELISTEGAGQQATGTCTDAAGNTASSTDGDVNIDKTAPSISNLGPTTFPNAAGWYKANVTNQFKASDALSGLASSCEAAFPNVVSGGRSQDKTTSGEGTAVTVSSDSCVDKAGNLAPAISSGSFQIDLTNPLVAITSPSTGSNTIALSIAVSGTASDALSGLASVTVNGVATTGSGTWNTSVNVLLACGPNTLTATATDIAGNGNTASVTVTRLCFTFDYLKPLDSSYIGGTVVVNDGKYGRVIPVKGVVRLGAAVNTEADLAGYGLTLHIGVNAVACSGGAATDSVEEYADAGLSNGGTNMFRWSLDGFWIYNLDTKAPPSITMQINKCYRLDAYVQDTATPVNKVKISDSPYAIFRPVK